MNIELRKHELKIVLLLSAIAVLAFALTLKITGPQLSWDGQDYAQLARQLVRGHGRTSKVLVSSLAQTVRDDDPWPSLFRPPFPVFLTSLSFRLFGISDTTAVLWSGLFYIGTVILIFFTFEPTHGAEVALLSAIIFALSGCGLVYARSGLTEPSAMFFLLCGFSAAVNKHSALSAIWAGVFLGLCALNRPVAYLWAVVILGYLFVCWDSRRQPRVSQVGLGSIGFLIPLLFVKVALHWKGGGHDLFAVNLASRVGDQALAIQSPVSFVLHHPFEMLAKTVHEAARVCLYLFQFGNITLFSALSIFALFRPVRPVERDARNITIALVFLTAVVLAFLTEGDAFVGPLRYFDVFTPLLLPWGVSAFLDVLNHRTDVRNYAIFALLGLYLLGAGAQAIRDPFAHLHFSEQAIYRELHEIVPETQVIAASGSVNVPSIAWYGDRRAVFIASDIEKSLSLLSEQGILVQWYFGKDSDQIPRGFLKLKQWPGGFVLFRKSD
jgi:4-amino-4-deoxy-L-arabinose transferase-like glycosyltransferase